MTVEETKEKLDVVSGMRTLNSIYVHLKSDEIILNKMVNRNRIIIKQQFRECQLEIYGTIFPIELKPITTRDFDLIVGMDCLSLNRGHILCDEKTLLIEAPYGSKIKIHG